MQVVAGMDPRAPLAHIGAHARRVEALGFDALHVAETTNDAFQTCLLALEHTSTLVVRPALALAFTRSPMQVAYSAWSLAGFAPGRFQLGLGTQIKPNIVGRFGVEWADPVERMADYVDAVRAVFTAFQEGGPLHHEGPHYRLTRLQPEFNPGPLEEGPLPIWLGGVNRRACRLAGATADGYVTHPTNSDRRYLGELCLPAIEEGLATAGRDRSDVQVIAGGMVATGRDDAAVDDARKRSRYMLGFLFSTPAYRRTLELHGWEDLGDRLRSMTKEGRWDELEAVVTDEVLDAVVAAGRYDQLAQVLGDRYADLADGVLLHPPTDPADDEVFADAVSRLRAVPAAR
jgi:probable F420-dependent oxidoreductase